MSSPNAIVDHVITAGAAQDTAGGIGSAKTRGHLAWACTVVFGAGTGAGVITVETAPNAEFTGTWHSLGTITWAAANRAHYLRGDGPVMALRARISTAVTGGTCEVYLHAVD